MADDAVSASAKGATFLILLQIISRAITFGLNQILLRFLSPELLGVSVQLELFKIGTMYFSREGFRVAAERRSDGGIQAAINLSYLSVLAGLPLGAAFAEWYLSMTHLHVPYFSEALRINQLAAFVELMMEPAFTAVQQNLLYKFRAAAEGASVILKTVTVFLLFFWGHKNGKDLGVLPYAAGELVNSIVLTTVYWILILPVARQKNFSLFLTKMKSSPDHEYLLSYFSKPLLWLIGSLWFQTGIKWLLTEGDKLLIGALASLEDQGMYALSANYGGLIARMLFQPIETSSRNLFANLCGEQHQAVENTESKTKSNKMPNGSTTPKKNMPKKDTSKKDTPSSKESLQSAANILRDILRVYSILSLLVSAIGPPAAPLLLRIVAGSRWSDSGAGDVLGIYCYYIPLLAINGVSEAFVAATASTKDLREQSFWMALFSGLFAASAYLFLRVLQLGAKGLVLANCVNMALRIAFNLSYIRGYFGRCGVNFHTTNIRPHAVAVGATAVAFSLISQSQTLAYFQQYGPLGELVGLGSIGVALLVTIALVERDFLKDCYRRVRS